MPISLNTLLTNRTSATIADNVITTTKISNSAITTPKLADGAVAFSKLDANTQANISEAAPKITTVTYSGDDLAASPDGGETVTLTGTGFKNGATIYIGSIVAPTVTFNNSTSLSFTTPALSAGNYLLYVINPDGSTGVGVPGLSISGVPTWTTAAGALANATESAYSTTVNATSDSNVSYSIITGALPSGLNLNANTGVISGTLTSNVANLSSNTTYNITIDAKDTQNQNTIRTFSITYLPTFPTWNSPNAGALTSGTQGTSYTANLNATSNSEVTYSIPSGNLVANIVISGNTLTGVPPDANTYYFTVRATDAEGHSTDRNFNVTFVSSETNFRYNTLLLTGDGTNGAQNNTFLDLSPNNYTITRSGNAAQGTFSPYSQTGWSNYFDGSGDVITFDDNSAFTLGSGNFTVEAWVYPTTTGVQRIISGQSASSASGSTISYWFDIDSANRPRILIWSGGTDYTATSSDAVSSHQWIHLAGVRNGNTLTIYVNGVSKGTVSVTGVTVNDSANKVAIGQLGEHTNVPWSGYISNFRLVKGTAVYTANFTPPTAALTAITNTSLLTCQSNRFVDNSANNFTPTVEGDTSVQAFSPFDPTVEYSASTHGGSVFIDAAGDRLSFGAQSSFSLGSSNDFCMEAWAYRLSSGVDAMHLWTAHSAGAADGFYFTYGGPIGANGITVYSSGGGGGGLSSNKNPPNNSWNHLCLTRQSGRMRIFLNGELTGTTTNSFTINIDGRAVTIGGGVNFSGCTGYIAQSRYINGSVPTDYQTSSTTLNTQIFTPPSTPLTTTSQGATSSHVRGLVTYVNAGITDSTGKNNIETVGNAQINTSTKKFGTGSLAFDGTGDYLVMGVGNSSNFAFGTGNFTIEMWIYFNNVSSIQTFFDGRPQGANGAYPLIYLNSDGTLRYFVNSADRITSDFLSAGTWYHIAISRSSTSTRMFLNGTQTGSTYTDSNSYLGTTNRPIIGTNLGSGSSTQALNGFIDDLRITNGLARYTSNFTPPTAALGLK